MAGRSSKRNVEADFNAYYRRAVLPHLDRILAVGRRGLRSQDLAWDAFQEALTSLWELAERPADPAPWLIRTMVHRSLHLRRCQARRLRTEQNAAGVRTPSGEPDPGKGLADQELQELLQQAITQLPADFEQVFRLREVERLDYESIAKQLQLPVGTVRSRLNRARLALRRLLAESAGEQDGWGNLGSAQPSQTEQKTHEEGPEKT